MRGYNISLSVRPGKASPLFVGYVSDKPYKWCIEANDEKQFVKQSQTVTSNENFRNP